MKINNEWLENEIKSIDKEVRRKKPRKDDMFYKLLFMILIFFVSCVKAYSEYSDTMPCCPNCNEDISDVVRNYNMGWIFPDTWTCPNRNCGYENYDGLSHCSVCGTRRK